MVLLSCGASSKLGSLDIHARWITWSHPLTAAANARPSRSGLYAHQCLGNSKRTGVCPPFGCGKVHLCCLILLLWFGDRASHLRERADPTPVSVRTQQVSRRASGASLGKRVPHAG